MAGSILPTSEDKISLVFAKRIFKSSSASKLKKRPILNSLAAPICNFGFVISRLDDKKIPIIFLTAKSQTSDVLEGFNNGGNDYLKKPFSMEELIVRINSLLNRIETKTNADNIKIGNYSFNLTKQTLENSLKIQQLTHREAQLLFHLFEKKNEILDRTFILNKLWGNDDFFNARSMDVFISKLRKKLKKDTSVQIINIRGFGYKLIC